MYLLHNAHLYFVTASFKYLFILDKYHLIFVFDNAIFNVVTASICMKFN